MSEYNSVDSFSSAGESRECSNAFQMNKPPLTMGEEMLHKGNSGSLESRRETGGGERRRVC